MDQLLQQVARAQRRLMVEQFVSRLGLALLATLTIAAVALAVPRVMTIESLPANWDLYWFGGALVAGLVGAIAWTFFTRRTQLDAAIEIDRRFDLRERVASSLSLGPELEATEVGQAVVNDAVRAVSRIDVPEKFHVAVDRRAWLPLVPAIAAFLLVALVDRRAESSIDPNSAANVQKQVKESAESLRKKIEERAKQAREKGLKDAEGIFKKLEQGTRELAEKNDVDRTKAAVKLNDLAKQLEKRRQQLGGKEGLRDQLQNMKNLAAGPAEKAAQAMKKGDWQKALQEVEKLTQQIREGKLDEETKKQLAQQLQQMKDKLEAAAQAHQEAQERLKEQIQKLKEQGNLAKAGEMQQKLDQMQQQQDQMDRLQQMAQQLAQAQQGMQKGDNQKAAEAMSQLAQELEQMAQEANEMEMLDAAMAQLEMAKDAMACGECQGKGCKACQGALANLDQGNQPNSGIGVGNGRGMGARGEKPEGNFRDTRVRDKPQQGPAVYGGTAAGPNVKGEVQLSINEEMSTLSAEPADPLTSERLSKSRREQAEQYFQLLREGK